MFGSFIDDGREWSLMEWKGNVRNGMYSYMSLYCLGIYNISGWNGKIYKSSFPFLSFYFVIIFFMYIKL